jgi:chromate reductase, NAD(P)H dehydrogenase (quinone)
MPGVLKNALDWASRPAKTSVVRGKPVVVMGASTGAFGTARCQMALRNVFAFCNMHPLNYPQVLISHADKKFDSSGKLTDETTVGFIRDNLNGFAVWVQILQQGKKAVEKTK